MKAKLFNIQKFSIHDGPGIRTVVFFKGCHLKCRWCSNPESQSGEIQLSFDKEKCTGCRVCVKACPGSSLTIENGIVINDSQTCTHCNACVRSCLNGAISFYGREYTVDEVLIEVLKDRAFYTKSGGGVTLSGGEFFLQLDFAEELCRKLTSENIKIAVETSLAVSSACIERLAGYVDTWLVDLKHHNNEQHILGTGIGNKEIQENIKLLISRQADVTVRIPIIPDYNDSHEDAELFGRVLNEIGVSKVELLPFHQLGEKKYKLLNMPYSMKGISQMNSHYLNRFSEIIAGKNIQIQTGG